MSTTEATLVDILRRQAEWHGDRLAYTYLEDGVLETDRLTYGDLDARARAIAARLQSVAAPGDRALLLFPAGLEFLAGLLGCLYAAIIAIPAPSPEASRLKRTGPRLRSIADDARASVVLTTSKIRALVEASDPPVFERGAVRWVETDQAAADPGGGWREPRIDGSQLAYLQYTSGSTSTPKGVMISHRNLGFQLANLQRLCGYGPDSVTVTWMPYFHDYGLVEGLLEPLFNATPCYVMSPFAFVKRPVAWLKAITRYHGTHSQAPNFAYDLCARRIPVDQRAGLDLGCWRNAGNAAEPINPRVLIAFHEAFRSVGFRWRASCPAYGLAEATLLVSASRCSEKPLLTTLQAPALESNRIVEADRDSAGARTIVGCGRIFDTTKVAIVRPGNLTLCDRDEVGEIWVSDPAVAEGYWQRPAETEQTFRAYTSDTGEGPFLRTGDLGFIKDDELFIASRLKDLVIIRGTNHYPQDIEWTVQASHPALRPENGAAFSVIEDGEEKLVITQEVEREHVQDLRLDEVVGAIRQSVAEAHELDVSAIVLLSRGSIPKTASAKIQRQACRAFYLHGGPQVVGSWVAAARRRDPRPAWLGTPVTASPATPRLPQPAPNGLHVSSVPTQAGVASCRKADDLIGWLRSYASERINSRLMDERRCIPPHVILDLGNRGILGLQVPRSHGGLELQCRDSLRVLEQIAAIDLNLAAVVFLHNTNGLRPIQYHAKPALRDELLPRLASGRELASFALSEPGAGSNVGGIQSLAQPRPDGGWRLRGVKRWNAASWAGVVSVFVRLVHPDGRLGGLTGFAVRQGTPGLRIGPEALTTGLRGSVQNSIYLEDVPVGPGEMLGEPGKGMEVADDALMAGRICTAAVGLGAMKRCAQLMERYAARRTIATGRLMDNPVTIARLGELTGLIAASQALLGQIADLLDAGKAVPGEIAMAVKISTSEAAVRAAGELMQLLGGRGYMENNIAPQILRDARVLTVGEGPNETLSWYLGRSASQTDVVPRFVAEAMAVPDLGSRFRADFQHVLALCTDANNAFSEPSLAQSWASYLVGQVATEGLLLAALANAARTHPAAQRDQLLAWATLRYDEALRRAAQAAVSGPQPMAQTASEISTIVAGYTESIGEVEQDLPGEELALDPLLRREPAAAPGTSPRGLPGESSIATVRDHPGARAAEKPMLPDQLSRLSPQSKREILKQALARKAAGGEASTPSQTDG